MLVAACKERDVTLVQGAVERGGVVDVARGQAITLHYGEQTVLGVAVGVDESGALTVDTPQGLQRFHGGEVSLRMQP